MTTTETACFEPSSKIREIREELFVGKIVTITLGHSNEHQSNQYVRVDHPLFDEYGLHISGWAGKHLGEEGEILRKKVTAFKLVEHRNGGPKRERTRSSPLGRAVLCSVSCGLEAILIRQMSSSGAGISK